MSSITVRNLPEETHRALRMRAAMAGRSTEAEVRAILESVARPEGRIKLGFLLAELRFGIAALAPGKRRDARRLASLEQRILPLFAGRILPFDAANSEAYALLRARARAQGKAVAPADCYIVATAILHRLMVATRDTGPFEAAGLTVINPWNTKQ